MARWIKTFGLGLPLSICLVTEPHQGGLEDRKEDQKNPYGKSEVPSNLGHITEHRGRLGKV